MTGLLRTVWRNLICRRHRTGLTVCGIAVGVALVSMVSLAGSAGKQAVSRELESMGINGLSFTASNGTELTEQELTLIRRRSSVQTAAPLMLEYSSCSFDGQECSSLICGVDRGAEQAIALSLQRGRLISRADVQTAARVCVIDEALAQALFGQYTAVGKSISVFFRGQEVALEIVGVTETGSSLLQSVTQYFPGMMYIPYTTVQQFTGRQDFNQIAVRFRPNTNISAVRSILISTLEHSDGGSYHAEDLSSYRGRMEALLSIVTVLLTVIGGVSLIVSGIGIMTAMLSSVQERTAEIGIKKALGAPQARILAEFVCEAAVISLWGTLIGLSVGVGIAVLAGKLFSAAVSLTPASLLLIGGGSVALGTAFGLYPALRASRLRPVEALRHKS